MANRFWVAGGTGNWSSTTNWSATSGGASGASVPGSADAALFDANSGAGTATVDSSVTIQTLTMTGFAGTLAFGTNTISLNSTGTIFTGATTYSVTGTPQIIATNNSATSRAITPTAVTEANSISFRITAGTGTLTLNAGSYRDLDFTDGVNPTGYAGAVSGGASINVFGNYKASTGMTQTAGAGSLIFAATSGTKTFTSAGVAFDRPITVNAPGATVQLQDNLTMGSTRTFTLTAGTLDLSNGNRTLSTGLFASNNSNTRSILFSTGNITITGNGGTVLQVSTATGLTYTGTPTISFTYSGATGTRNLRFGNGGGFTETNSPNINITAGTDIVSFEGGAKNFSLNGFTGTFSNNPRTIYGNFTLTAGITLTAGTLATTFAGTSGTQQITTGGITLDFPLTFNGIGGTFAFQDALTQGSTRAFTITDGTVQLKNGVTSTVGAFATSGTNSKFLQSTLLGSQATLSQASGTVNASYLTIRDINATGGATWNAFTTNNNVNAGNNLGWDFSSQLGKYIYTRRKNKRILP